MKIINMIKAAIALLFFSYSNFTVVWAQSDVITILHTNDLHAQFLPVKATWKKETPKPLIGGMEALYHYVQLKNNDKTLILDAGDTQTGTPLSDIIYQKTKGGGYIRMMNLIGYHASVIGNHEFDNGWENTKQLIKMAAFNWLSANLKQQDSLFTGKAHHIYQIGKLRVGVIGLTIEPLYGLVPKRQLDSIQVLPVIQTAQKQIEILDKETDLIILLTHHGYQADSLLAVSTHGADIIIGGHSHTRLYSPKKVNGIHIVQAGSKCRYLGKVDVSIRADSVYYLKNKLIPLWADQIPSNKMSPLVNIYQEKIDSVYGKVIGEIKTTWQSSYFDRSDLGTYLADIMRKHTKTDFAVLNSGGIRKGLQKGPVRKLDIVEMLPFSNFLIRFQCKGAHLTGLIENNAKGQVKHTHGSLQYAGIEYTIQKNGQEYEIQAMTVNRKSIDPDKTYTGCTVDYIIYDNAEKYMGFTPAIIENTRELLSDVITHYIEKNPVIQ